mmetsp:Transcript_8043/g.9631  ORF Transcript_8043/g.9631 Transcript_8043/m.9631 type:complete len:117 (-) Transcript_8043:748-1098(-)
MVEALQRFGMNYLTVDYYFAILTLAHTYSLNREDLHEATQLESYLHQYLCLHKVKWQTAQVWLCKLERLVRQKELTEALASVHHMTKFCTKYGLFEYKFRAQAMLTEIYIATGNSG